MTKVYALAPFVGSFPATDGMVANVYQTERRTREGGEVFKVEVGYVQVQACIATTQPASPNDIADNHERVAAGGENLIAGQGRDAVLHVPGMVKVGHDRVTGRFMDENPEFELPDDVAQQWADDGLVAIVAKPESGKVPRRSVQLRNANPEA